MTENNTTSSTNHKRSLLVIFLVLAAIFIGWNSFGAYQCSARGGDVQLDGLGIRCFLDLSNR